MIWSCLICLGLLLSSPVLADEQVTIGSEAAWQLVVPKTFKYEQDQESLNLIFKKNIIDFAKLDLGSGNATDYLLYRRHHQNGDFSEILSKEKSDYTIYYQVVSLDGGFNCVEFVVDSGKKALLVRAIGYTAKEVPAVLEVVERLKVID